MNVYILSDSQAATKALDSCKITSKLVWDCHQSLMYGLNGTMFSCCGCQEKQKLKVMRLLASWQKGLSAPIYRT